VLCHNPNLDNSARVPRLEGSTVVANPLTFKDMIHGIHMGELHDQPYVAGGSNPTTANPGGAPLSFNEVRFPRSPSDCSACHAAKTNELPIVATALPSHWETLTCTDDPAADTDAYCTNRTSVSTYTGPATAACTSCHDSPATAAHAALNTTSTGAEACATCHGPGKSFDAAVAHAPTP
jgi:OmcA/MtrC family decaheme c-type cytochrome